MNRSTVLHGAVALALATVPFLANGSSHREAPFITNFPKVDGTDLFMFNSYEAGREGYVTLIANYYPLQEPGGGPNYFQMDDTAEYSIRIDNDGDAVQDLQFIFRFNNLRPPSGTAITLPIGSSQVPVPLQHVGPISPDDQSALNTRERYRLVLRRGTTLATQGVNGVDGTRDFTKPYDFAGTKTFGSEDDYETYARQYIYTVNIPGCGDRRECSPASATSHSDQRRQDVRPGELRTGRSGRVPDWPASSRIRRTTSSRTRTSRRSRWKCTRAA